MRMPPTMNAASTAMRGNISSRASLFIFCTLYLVLCTLLSEQSTKHKEQRSNVPSSLTIQSLPTSPLSDPLRLRFFHRELSTNDPRDSLLLQVRLTRAGSHNRRHANRSTAGE